MGRVALLNYSKRTGHTKGNKPGSCAIAHKLCADPVWAAGVVVYPPQEDRGDPALNFALWDVK